MVIPLVITPFLTRSLLEDELGRFSFSRSIASFFVIISMMGISKYGQRVISQNVDNELKLRKSFWSLFYVHILFSIIGILLYVLMIVFVLDKNRDLFWIQSIYVGSALFDITWLFYGLEDFKGVVLRSGFIKVLEAVLYIFLVKSPEDILLYAFINCSAIFLNQIVLLPRAIKEIKPILIRWDEYREHIKPIIVFAAAVIGISLYTVFDTTLLGFFSTNENVAFYEYSNRIAKIPLMVASIIGTVLFPRACKLVAQNNIEGQRKYFNYSIVIVSLVGAVSFWGLLIVGEPLAELYLGKNFRDCGPIISTLAPLVYIIGIGDVVRTQLMIPNRMDREYIISIIISAAINLFVSTLLILNLPEEIQVYGAVIGTISAESVGMIYQLVLCSKLFSIRNLMKTIVFSFSIGAIMYVILKFVVVDIEWSILSLGTIILLGALIFIPLAVGYIYLFEKDFKNIIFRK